MVQTNTVLSVMLICAVQCIIPAGVSNVTKCLILQNLVTIKKIEFKHFCQCCVFGIVTRVRCDIRVDL